MRHVAIALLHLVMTIALANAQDRGAMTIQVPVDGRKESRQLYSASHALVIGIDKYTDNGWPPLHNAISDAEKIANALREHGFKVMFAKNLKSAELISTLQDFFINTGKDPEARLLLWYAGHGHSMPEPSEEGYLVPADAPPAKTDTEFRRKALALSLFSYLMTQARAKHVLAVFDSCFSGTALAITRDAEMTGPPEIALQTGGRARQIISSGDRNQKVSDNGNFRQIFLDAISGKVPNVGSNGYVTAQELGAYLRREMSRLTVNTATPQTPNTGYLARVGYNLGDFVFRVPGKGVASAEPVRPTPPPPPIPCDEVPLQVGEEQKCVKSGFGKVEWFKDCPTCPEMVMVPAGKFTMGSPVNEPERDENIEAQLEVTISKPFAVGRFAVTRSEFAVFVRDANHVMEEKCVIELSVGIGPHPVLPATAVPMMAARKAFRSPQLGEAMELLIDAENILERAFTAARAARSSAAAGTGTTAAQLLVTSRHVETTLSLVEEVARLQDRIEDLTWRAEREHRLAPNGMDMATKDELARVLDGVIGLKKRDRKSVV